EVDRPLGELDQYENPEIPAGYTYLGQFIGHDITFDPASSLQRQNDPHALHNFRTPRLDLDSIYGRGPADQPYLYRQDRDPIPSARVPGLNLNELIFLLGADVDPDDPASEIKGPDLPRNLGRERLDGRALVGDPRSDENLIISQLHVLFLRFHNRMVDFVAERSPLRGENLFKETQRLVRWHYQWVVAHDFLARFVGKAVVKDILAPQRFMVNGEDGPEQREIVRPRFRFYRHPGRPPFIPIEFSVAAYRFGHSTVRPSYFFNDFVRKQTEPGRTPIFQPTSTIENETKNLNGFRRLPDKWGFQWKYFFDRLSDEDNLPQLSHKIDDELASSLGSLPSGRVGGPSSLAERNLRRGLHLQVPSGQAVAMAMGIPPLAAKDLDLDDLSAELRSHTPLWYYILREAKVQRGGCQLGSVGGRIVAEVLLGLLAADPLSYLNAGPGWTPEDALTNEDGDFEMPELIKFALSA
ncbi:MAG: peroxidase family protein, partial [Actinomycetota bacterium]